jgi:hypothetical protein
MEEFKSFNDFLNSVYSGDTIDLEEDNYIEKITNLEEAKIKQVINEIDIFCCEIKDEMDSNISLEDIDNKTSTLKSKVPYKEILNAKYFLNKKNGIESTEKKTIKIIDLESLFYPYELFRLYNLKNRLIKNRTKKMLKKNSELDLKEEVIKFNTNIDYFEDYFYHFEVRDEDYIHIPEELVFNEKIAVNVALQLRHSFIKLYKSLCWWEFCSYPVFRETLEPIYNDIHSKNITYLKYLQYKHHKEDVNRLKTLCRVFKSLEDDNFIDIALEHFSLKQELLFKQITALGGEIEMKRKEISLVDNIKPFINKKDLILFNEWMKKNNDNKGFSYFYHRIKNNLINCSQREYISHLHENNFINEENYNYYLDNYITSFKNCNSQTREDYFELLNDTL